MPRPALVTCLPAYGIAIATVRSSSRVDLPCLYTTGAFFAYIALRALTSPAPYAARADLYSVLAALTVYSLTLSALEISARRIALIVSLLAFAVVA